MDKNTIIAIVLIFSIVFAFQFLYLRPRLEQTYQEIPQELKEEPVRIEEKELPEMAGEEPKLEILGLEAQEKKISIDTSVYHVELSTAGASLVSLQLKKYLDRSGIPIELVDYSERDMLPFEVHFDKLKDIPSGDRSLYFVEKLSDTSYTFFRDFKDRNGNTFRFSKTYLFQEDEYIFDLFIKVFSLRDEELYLNRDNVSYTLAFGPVLGPVSVIKNRYNITTQGYYEEGRFRKVLRGAGGCSLRGSGSRYVEVARILDWVGIANRYFFIGIIPDQKNYLFAFDQRTEGKFFLGVSHPFFKGDKFEDRFRIYAGPKERKLLKKYGNNFESVMGSRILKPIVVFLELTIKLFYKFTKNYGMAIILMTILIKIILHPLTFKSFESMRRMSTLQPKINEIRERNKNNPQQMNRETSALYRKEKINPMGGCLPLLLQLPIFYALYNLLSSMIELRNESFLWIKDLTLPDTVVTINTMIPLLGYRLGSNAYTDINILPFIMTGTTLLQSKLTSGDQSNQQTKMMTYIFPLVFFFIFWNMPSGLVLYWTIQNILTIGQQYWIDYRMKKKAGIPAKVPVKSKFKRR